MAIDADPADAELTAATEDDADGETANTDEGSADAKPVVGQHHSGVRLAMCAGLITVLVLSGLGGWLGYQAYQTHRSQQQRDLMLQAGRQAALNLTSINYSDADTDVQRIVDSATGTFREDFQKRSHAFVDGFGLDLPVDFHGHFLRLPSGSGFVAGVGRW